ncbi:MAG TPA: hypothetical protein VFE11_10605, partial [Dongiaceae bacterium]|nr:hypothetical protein [Dongiaceae bacterium]
CRRLDGLPLAIELAAARVRGMSVEELAARLDDRFGLLTGGSRTAPARHQTLQATIDWSYELLSEDDRALFAGLAVFRGGWTLPAAEHVCAAHPNVMNGLFSLVDRSLVVADESGGTTRYRFLESIGAYARARFEALPDSAPLQERHADYMAEQAGWGLTLDGNARLGWLARMATEEANLMAALEWSASDSRQPEQKLRIAATLGLVWSYNGRSRDVRSRLGPLADDRVPPESPAGARLLGCLAWAATDLAEYDDAEALCRRVEAAARTQADLRLLGDGLRWRALVAERRGDVPLMEDLMQAARACYVDAQDRLGQASVLTGLALPRMHRRDFDAVRRLLDEARRLAGEDDDFIVAQIGHEAAYAAFAQGDYHAARDAAADSLRRYSRIGHAGGSILALVAAALAATDLGQAEEAASYLTEALGQARRTGAEWGRTYGLAAASYWALRQARMRPAAELMAAFLAALDARGVEPIPLASELAAIVRDETGGLTDAWQRGMQMGVDDALRLALDELAHTTGSERE